MASAERKQRKTCSFTRDLLVLGGFIGAVSYRTIPETYRFNDIEAYCLLWFVSLVLGIVTTPRLKQGLSTALGILLIPFSIDCLNAYDSDAALLMLMVCFGSVCCYSLVVMIQWLRQRIRMCTRKKKLRCFQNYLFRCRQIVSLICAGALIVLAVGSGITASQEKQTDSQRGEVLLHTVGDDADLIRQLRENAWKRLDREQRLSLLQQVADAECRYLGIPFSLRVYHEDLRDRSLRGFYRHNKLEICISNDVIDNDPIDRVLSTLFHEVFHSYEFCLVLAHSTTDSALQDLRLYQDARVYSAEFADYINGSQDYDGYRQQAVERHSNAYAQERLQDYRDMRAYLRSH